MATDNNKPSSVKTQSSTLQPNRRSFLKAAGAGALLAGSSQLSQASDQSSNRCKTGCDYDVVVIGGGFAGVTAARDSQKNGYKTLLLEARNRFGGRTFSSQFEGHKVELGGTWIHHSQPYVWAEKERYDLEVLETPGAVPEKMFSYFKDKTKQLNETEIYALFQAFDAYTAQARDILERPYDILYKTEKAFAADAISAYDHLKSLKLDSATEDMMEGWIGSMAHNNAKNMSYIESLRWMILPGGGFDVFLDAVARFKFKDGTIGLINKMLEDGKPETRLSTPVKKVEDQGDHVKITTARGDVITAGATIIALPMNVLPKVEFSPALDNKLIEAANEKHTGAGFKIFVKVKGQHGKVFGMANSGFAINTLFTYHEAEDHTLLCGFGSDPSVLDIYDDEAVQAAVTKLIPGAVVESSFSYDWQLDPFSEGTYASYKPNWLKKYYAHFQKDKGRVIFGQGDHGEGWRGFIDGAIGAGMKAAQRTKKLLG